MPPRPTTGNVFESHGSWFVRVRLSATKRPALKLAPGLTDEARAARGAVVADLAARLRTAGVSVDVMEAALERVALREGALYDDARAAAERLARGEMPPTPKPAGVTVRQLGERWTKGELARDFPDHIKAKASAEHDAYRLGKHVYPHVGDVEIAAFTLEHALEVMRKIPASASASTRRQVGQAMHRLLQMAVFPLRLRADNPLPEGFLPKPAPRKAQGYVRPDEDRKLLACSAVPLCWRILYGFAHREGTRRGEALALRFADLDLDVGAQGAMRLDVNKTSDARAWALSPGTAEALSAWRGLRKASNKDHVFINTRGGPVRETHLADLYREHLKLAGITRPELFARGPNRQRVTFHATRAAFVTVSLAAGESEWKVTDKTGHRDASQIARYRRQARTAAELQLGTFAPLNEAIPELRGAPTGAAPGSGSGSNRADGGDGSATQESRKPSDSAAVRRKGLEPLQELPHWNLNAPHPAPSGVSSGQPSDVTPPIVTGGPTAAAPLPGPLPASGEAPPPRAAAIAALFAQAAAAAQAGDLSTAEALQRAAAGLLGAPPPTTAPTAPAVDRDAKPNNLLRLRRQK